MCAVDAMLRSCDILRKEVGLGHPWEELSGSLGTGLALSKLLLSGKEDLQGLCLLLETDSLNRLASTKRKQNVHPSRNTMDPGSHWENQNMASIADIISADEASRRWTEANPWRW